MFSRRSRSAFRVFFATDVHGSDRCFRKFLAASKVYEANALVLGGDIVGKAIVPLARENGCYRFSFQGQEETCTDSDLEQVRTRINFNGFYPWTARPEDVKRLHSDKEYGRQVFAKLIVDQVAGWCNLAMERLADDVRCVITPGNDDPLDIDPILQAADKVESPEGDVVALGPVWLASLGNTNPTPWRTDREYEESELAIQIEALLAPVADGRPLVFNFHAPPYQSGLDRVVELDRELRPVVKGGNPVEISVGSTAVRDAIMRYQPVVGLHGHIHEAQGVQRLGRTVCANPGSEYSAGILKGVIVDLTADGQYCDHLLTAG